jgi:histidinol-phosphate aminotransferase
MDNREVFRQELADIQQLKEELKVGLEAIPGIKVFPSEANFFLIQTAKAADRIHQQLIELGVLVRYLGAGPGLVNCLRISVGSKEENSELLSKLRAIMEA